ncbi:uncharacterized protein [Medicago truncatula]|uniref:uncharacterized protein n=1 Tax=Medicago truncatula TaxID=3880 RepID=UPI001966E036|nr:uncharacterized protein LOC120576084 [Medicago truncatula]
MNVIAWNCRGLGNVKAVPCIKDLVRVYKPDILILIETLCNNNKIFSLKYSVGFDHHFSVDCIGRSGGLAVLWRNSAHCSITSYSLNFINMSIQDPIKGPWRLTAFYGYPEHGRRRNSWDLLRSLHTQSDDPWCIIGDFNDHLSSFDKRGGPDRPRWLIQGFQEAVTDCGLTDLPLIGYQFTWFKSIGTSHAKEARIDRALCSAPWQNLFPHNSLQTLVAPMSDHTPLLLQHDPATWRTPHNSFRFNNSWLIEPDLSHYVKDNWSYYPTSNIVTKLNYCVEDMKLWSKANHPHFNQRKMQLKNQIETMRASNDATDNPRLLELQNSLTNLLLQEDVYWRQRSKIYWLKDGDTNSKFFHCTTSSRRRKI